MLWTTVDSPVGPLAVAVDGGALCELWFGAEAAGERVDDLPEVTGPLRRYFDGDLAALDPLRVAPTRGTPFQRAVWGALREIPAGATASYGDIARRIGRPSAVRAVGAANGANPIGIVVPCHRVIGTDGSLTGYAGGLERKRWLLRHERAILV
jgi:methylated-DNA-[protein]-cysteine S-methyltransferase